MMTLGDRMKRYEEANRGYLPPRLPVILRVDGKGFSRYTRGMPERPFNRKMMAVMEQTAIELCQQVQGAQFAYVQSDEISILIHGYKSLDSQPWFDNQIQKMCSVAASVAGVTFTMNSWKIWAPDGFGDAAGYMDPAYFDARVFVVPEADVCNYFIWRQQDAIRNSISGLARTMYSHREVEGKNSEQMKEMCRVKGNPWENLTPSFRHGRVVMKIMPDRRGWETNTNIPLFTEDRQFIEQHLVKNEESNV